MKKEVQRLVDNKLANNSPFTSACISHQMIEVDPTLRHYDISAVIKGIWQKGISGYDRTMIKVYPDGPSSTPMDAFLYHPVGYDPNIFPANSRVLKRQSGIPKAPVTKFAINKNSSTAMKQCKIQTKRNCLNIPCRLVKVMGWNVGQALDFSFNGTLVIKAVYYGSAPTSVRSQKVDKEGRIRVHPKWLKKFGGAFSLWIVVDPQLRGLVVSSLAPVASTGTASPKFVTAPMLALDGGDNSLIPNNSVWATP